MEVLSYTYYLDGGTVIVTTKEGIFTIDNRIKSRSKGTVYKGDLYDGGTIIDNQLSIKDSLYKALEEHLGISEHRYKLHIEACIETLKNDLRLPIKIPHERLLWK